MITSYSKDGDMNGDVRNGQVGRSLALASVAEAAAPLGPMVGPL